MFIQGSCSSRSLPWFQLLCLLALAWKPLEANASYDPNPNESVNDTNKMVMLSHDSDVALSDQEEITELHRNLEHLSENDSVREERTPEKRESQSFPEDGLGYNGAGKSLVLYETFRVKTQDGFA